MIFTTMRCPFCGTKYEVPEPVRKKIESREISCVDCPESWVPFPSSSFWSRWFGRGYQPTAVDLAAYRRSEEDPFSEPLSELLDGSGMAQGRTVTADLVTKEATTKGPGAELNPLGTVLDLRAAGQGAASVGTPVEGVRAGFVGLDGRFKGRSYRVQKSPVLIGRTLGDMTIPDERVSAKHAQLDALDSGQFTMKDLASTNGTQVNERSVSTTALRSGDIVSFGGVRFRFLVLSDPARDKAP